MTRRVAVAALAAMSSPRAWGGPRPGLERTFLQPWRRHLEWSPAQWAGLLDWLQALSVRQVALQWTSWNGIDYSELAASLESQLASRRMKLWLGLAFDDEFWCWQVAPDGETSQRLTRWRERSLEQASRLASGAVRGRAFAGWYLPEEFDAARWGSAAGDVSKHLSAARQALRRIANKPVAVSGFPSAQPAEAARFWRAALSGHTVDQLWMQDGIGAGKSSLERWPGWAAQVARSLWSVRCRMSVVVESFEPGAGDKFNAKPAPSPRLFRQIEHAARLSDGPVSVFDIPDYMSPAGGIEAEALGRAYAAARGIILPEHLCSNAKIANR